MAYLFDLPARATDSAGTPASGAKAHFYQSGTTIPAEVYADANLTTPLSNPVVADGEGRLGSIYLSPGTTYRVVVTNASGSQTLFDIDPYISLAEDLAKSDFSNITTAIVGLDPNYQGSGNPAILHNTTLVFAPAAASGPTDAANAMFLRHAFYTGGTAGNTNNALKVVSEVGGEVTAFEWAFLSVMDNSATAGENTAGYFQALKRSSGPTFGAVVEVIETNAVNNPTSGTVGQEIDVSVNGTDANCCRIASDVVIRRYNPGGANAVAGYGYRIQNGGYSNSLVRVGYGFSNGMRAEVGFDTSNAVMLQAAFRMAEGQRILWDVLGVHKTGYDPGTSGIVDQVSNANVHIRYKDGTWWHKPLTVSQLPQAGMVGRRSFVIDATSTTFAAAAVGGGSHKMPVFDDGGSWRIG